MEIKGGERRTGNDVRTQNTGHCVPESYDVGIQHIPHATHCTLHICQAECTPCVMQSLFVQTVQSFSHPSFLSSYHLCPLCDFDFDFLQEAVFVIYVFVVARYRVLNKRRLQCSCSTKCAAPRLLIPDAEC